jgi:hypothetical protein
MNALIKLVIIYLSQSIVHREDSTESIRQYFPTIKVHPRNELSFELALRRGFRHGRPETVRRIQLRNAD